MPRYKTPPHNLEAERSVIGSVFIVNDCLQHIDLSPGDFHATAHQIIWKAILEVSAAKHPIDIITICNHLKKSNSLEAAGHVPGIAEIVDSVPTAANVSVYVKIMKDKSARRKFIEQMRGLAVQAYDDDPMENIIDEAQVTFRYIMEDLGGKKKTMAEEVREWVLSTQGHFVSTDVHKYLQVSTTLHKKNISEIFRRLIDEGVIERVGDKNGHFRKVDIECEALDWQNADETITSIRWPLAIETLVRIHPGNVIIIAGETNSGKTSFALNTALMNKDFKVTYFSSEMGEQELKLRIKNFNLPFDEWDHVKFKERNDNFADVVTPGEGNINIIDYMEEGDEAWKVKTHIDEVWKKLNGAIAIICLQKPKGRDEAFGGEGTARRARVYISLKHGEAKIYKAKSYIDHEDNPKDKILKYKLIAGSKYIVEEDWHHPDEPAMPAKRPWYNNK